MKKSLQTLGAVVLAVSFGISAPLSASGASYEDGFAVSGNASPALPSCTEDGVFEEFTLSNLGDPFSDATGGNEPLGSNSLALVKSRDNNFPWALRLISSNGGELRYDSETSEWIGSDDPAFQDAEPWSSAGLVYGRSSEGRYYVSYDTDEGVFLADSDPGASVSYTPTEELNDCVEQAAVLKGSVKLTSGSNGSNSTGSPAIVSALAFTGLDEETVGWFIALGIGSIAGGALLIARRRRTSR
jgi:LPXTG-motif cell wall-anchored protein